METESGAFQFVVENAQKEHQVRSHVMRGSWRTRKSRNVRQPRPKIRRLTPKTIVQGPRCRWDTETKICDEDPQMGEAALPTPTTDLQLYNLPIARIFADQERALVSRSVTLRSGRNGTLYGSGVTPSLVAALKNPWTIESNAPFMPDTTAQPYISTSEVLQSIGNYVQTLSSFATGTANVGNPFGLQNALHRRANRLTAGRTNPWVSLDLHNSEVLDSAKVSSVVFFKPEWEPRQLIRAKVAGIALMNSLIRDPILSRSDDLVRLIMYQIASEGLWGSLEGLNTHILGILEIVELRGGLESFKVELHLQALVFSGIFHFYMPYWAAKAISPSPVATKSSNVPPLTNKFTRRTRKQRICSDFVSLVHRLQKDSSSSRLLFNSFGEPTYPFLHAAPRKLRDSQFVDKQPSSYGWFIESAHLACLLYVAITCRDTLQNDNFSDPTHNPLDELNTILGRRKARWMEAKEELMNVMLSSDDGRIRNPNRAARMLEMLEMTKLLARASWDCVRDTLMELLMGEIEEGSTGLCWDSRSFLGEVEDRKPVFPVVKEDSILFAWIVNLML